jgi:hypothetical protein
MRKTAVVDAKQYGQTKSKTRNMPFGMLIQSAFNPAEGNIPSIQTLYLVLLYKTA